MKNKRFIMLGERNEKGRIVKNESYTIDEFMNHFTAQPLIRNRVIDALRDIPSNEITFWDLFSPKRFKNKIKLLSERCINNGYYNGMSAVKEGINKLIDEDNVGKKKR